MKAGRGFYEGVTAILYGIGKVRTEGGRESKNQEKADALHG